MQVLYYIFIFPLEYLMDLGLKGFYGLTDNVGVSILLLSLVVNTILLPLYYLAEAWQNRERRLQLAMAPRLVELKKKYRGEALYNKTTELYKEFSYHPAMSLRTSFGFFIQVPFFLAAYILLSHHPLLEGASFLGLSNLGEPDGLIPFFGYRVNLLPFVMTAFNLVSAFFYSKELLPLEKFKLVAVAAVFLILLYTADAGLVLYWTFNNIYSLAKNIIHPPVELADSH